MRLLGIVGLLLGIVVDAITLLSFAHQGYVSFPAGFRLELTPTRIWILALFGILITAFFFQRVTGRWVFDETRDGRVPVQAFFIVGPWVVMAGMATGMW
jgi:hypothetical protein